MDKIRALIVDDSSVMRKIVERSLRQAGIDLEKVVEASNGAEALAALNDLYDVEVLPVFAAIGLGAESLAYRQSVIERFRNPYLDHYLRDIFTNHAAKKQRRFGGLIGLG